MCLFSGFVPPNITATATMLKKIQCQANKDRVCLTRKGEFGSIIDTLG